MNFIADFFLPISFFLLEVSINMDLFLVHNDTPNNNFPKKSSGKMRKEQ